ncbi:MAG TPA: hypothetical protein VN088_14070 [Nocardioides sp.]|nr:hypothetical protein [Nocardioides sp.]
MEGNSSMSGRAGLLARSRRYLAAVVTGGVAVGGGLTIAAAHVGSVSASSSRSPDGDGSRSATAKRTSRAGDTRPAPSATSSVRAVPHHARRTAPRPAATTHAS